MIALGQGHVFHSRKIKTQNSFRYPSFFLFFKCTQEDELQQVLRKKFFGLFSIRADDYLHGKETEFDKNIKSFLKQKCNYHAEEVWLHTMPRMFNYVFNPVSFWFCYRDGKIDAVLVEVNNTFKERHFYWIHPEREITSEQWFKADKVFHVSPFFPVEGYYQFRFQITQSNARIDINYYNPIDELSLVTWVTGDISPLINHSRLQLLWRFGWLTPLVIIRIHFQAIKLWFKKVKFYQKPNPPHKDISS